MFDWERRTQIIVFVLVGALLFGGGFKLAKMDSAPTLEIIGEQEWQEESQPDKIYVHVAGAVKNPGVYTFDSGARVNDAVKEALPLPEAYLDGLNLAALLEDGVRVEVPVNPALAAGSEDAAAVLSGRPAPNLAASGAGSGKVNINTATAEELDTLPGIGPAYAERIISYREEHGSFSSIEELQEVSGIGPKTFEKLKDMVSIY